MSRPTLAWSGVGIRDLSCPSSMFACGRPRVNYRQKCVIRIVHSARARVDWGPSLWYFLSDLLLIPRIA